MVYTLSPSRQDHPRAWARALNVYILYIYVRFLARQKSHAAPKFSGPGLKNTGRWTKPSSIGISSYPNIPAVPYWYAVLISDMSLQRKEPSAKILRS